MGKGMSKEPLTGMKTLVMVAGPQEMTCLACGETFLAGEHCVRCGLREDPGDRTGPYKPPPPSVPTISYLREDEYYVPRY